MTINIHEPLEVIDKKHPEEIFNRDILKRSQLAERILFRLREEDCPRAIGIYGGWGTGKTSLLNLMEQKNLSLQNSPVKIHVEIIDAWEYEASDGLLVPVIVSLKKMMGDIAPSDTLAPVIKRVFLASGFVVADTLLKRYTDLGLAQMTNAVKDIVIHESDMDYDMILKKWAHQSDEVSKTKQAFARLVELAAQNSRCEKIAICIDNLDRCSPENVVRLLESVKVFFNVPGCIWVFAVDSEVIASYIDHKYAGTKMDGNSYLDKIIPEQYHLSLSPTIDRDNIVNLLRVAARRQALDLNERNIPQLPRVLVPRRLIKSASKLAEFKRQRGADGLNVSDVMVFNLALLYHAWPDFYQRFSSASDEHIRGILDHFFPIQSPTPSQPGEPAPNASSAFFLLKDETEDRDLFYFLKTVFSNYPKSKDSFVRELINGIRGLRKVGLP
jgi:hypothetical protein